jgi:predicted N-acetyltransferase YhbS
VLEYQNYYPRFGFVPASTYGISAPFEVPDENFLVMELKLGVFNKVSGTVEYSRQFFNE